MENNRTSHIVLVLIAIIIIGAIAVYFSMNRTTQEDGIATPPSVTLSKNYTNPAWGLSMMYPGNLKVDESKPIVSFDSSSPNFTIHLSKLNADPKLPIQDILTTTEVDANTGKHPGFSSFQKMVVGGNTYYMIRSELFEGVLGVHYYVAGPKGVYLFEVVSRGVDWTNPKFDSNADAGNVTARKIFTTLKFD